MTDVSRPSGRAPDELRTIRIERQYGSFSRSFTLPSSVDPNQVSAHYDKGVLMIDLAKKAEVKPKQIKVNVGSGRSLESKIHSKAA